MSSFARRIQGHHYGVGADQSTTLEFKQFIGDFDMAGNVVYCLVSLALLGSVAVMAIQAGWHEALAVISVIALGFAVIALRIKIFNRYAFALQRIGISVDGDLEWLGGWLAQSSIAGIEVQPGSRAGEFKLVCRTHAGDAHEVGTGLSQIKAEAIRRDITQALTIASQVLAAGESSPSLRALAGEKLG